MKQKSEFFETKLFSRFFSLNRDSICNDSRTVGIAFSSEMPVERHFGSEILDHKPESVRLGRLNNSGPVLVNHNLDDQVGVIESARVDSDKVGRAIIRFGKSDRASEIFEDIKDGIRTQISVGYAIHKMEMENENPPIYRVVDHEPYEISLVSSGADQSVGIGRNSATIIQTEILKIDSMEREKMEITEQENPVIDTKKIREEVQKQERKRIHEIESYSRQHQDIEGIADLAREYIKEGKSEADFAVAILKEIINKPKTHADIGLSAREIPKFSWMKLINHMAKPGSEKNRREAEFEINACIEAEKKQNKAARGFIIPNEVLNYRNIKTKPRLQIQSQDWNQNYGTRELLAGSGDGANLVPTFLESSSFIEFLDNAMVSVKAGATVLRNLDGIIKIPRRDAAVTGGWLAETADAADVTPSYDQVTLQLKTYGLRTDISRQLRLQTSQDVESLVAREISLSCALALDKAAMTGPGTGNAPLGVGVQTGVGVQALATANQITWAEAIGLQTDVMSANAFFGTLAYAIHPTLAGDAKGRSRDTGSGRYVMENDMIDGFPAYISAQVKDLGASGANNAIFGNWADCLIGYFSNGIDISVHKEFDDGRIRLLVFVDADCNVRHAASFSRTSNP